MIPTIIDNIVTIVIVAVVVVLLYIYFRRLYYRVPPNKVLVVYGRGKTVFDEEGQFVRKGIRLITGGGGFVLPYLEAYDFLDLTVMTIAVEKDEVYTIDGIPIMLDWVAQVQIAADEESILTAARAFLGRTRDDVRNVVAQTLSANFRAIVGQLTVEDVHRNRDAFVNRVQQLAADDMAAMGAKVISMGIEEITDEKGYFEAMAAPQIALVKRDAAIAEAEADREARVRTAEALREAEQAELNAQRAILEQSEALNLREVQKNKTVRLAETEADEAVQKRRALVVKEQQEVEVLVPARAQREAIEIQADADRRQATINADAKAAVKLKEAEASAEARRREADGQASAVRIQATADAEAIELTGKAEASKLFALKEAEANGTEVTLLAEAKGMRELAEATAAENEINLRETVARLIIEAEVQKMQALGEALKGIGEKVRIVQINGGAGGGETPNALMDTLKGIPELATIINAQSEALTGDNLEELFRRISQMLRGTEQVKTPVPEARPPESKVEQPQEAPPEVVAPDEDLE